MSMIQHVKRLKDLGMDHFQADEIVHTIDDALANHATKLDVELAVSRLETTIAERTHSSTRWIVGSVFFAVMLQCVNSWIMFALKQ